MWYSDRGVSSLGSWSEGEREGDRRGMGRREERERRDRGKTIAEDRGGGERRRERQGGEERRRRVTVRKVWLYARS